jgi:ribulose-phosphate 3-epimerase
MVLIMSVNPGFGAQKFIPAVLPKIQRLRELILEREVEVEIEVDGGMNSNTISRAAAAGANIFVAGNAVFTTEDYEKTIGTLRSLAESADRPA